MSEIRFSKTYLGDWKSISKYFKNINFIKNFNTKSPYYVAFRHFFSGVVVPIMMVLRPLGVLAVSSILSHMSQITFGVCLYGLNGRSMGYSFYNHIFLALVACYNFLSDIFSKKVANYEIGKIRRNCHYIFQRFAINLAHALVIDRCFAHYNPLATICLITSIHVIKKIMNIPENILLKSIIALFFCHINYSVFSDIIEMKHIIKEVYKKPGTWAELFKKNARLTVLAVQPEIKITNANIQVPSKIFRLLPNSIRGHGIWYILLFLTIAKSISKSDAYPGHNQKYLAEIAAQIFGAIFAGSYYFSSIHTKEKDIASIVHDIFGRGNVKLNDNVKNNNTEKIFQTTGTMLFMLTTKKFLDDLNLLWAKKWYPKSHEYWALIYSKFYGLPLAADRHLQIIKNDGHGYIGDFKIKSKAIGYGVNLSKYLDFAGNALQKSKADHPVKNRVHIRSLQCQPLLTELHIALLGINKYDSGVDVKSYSDFIDFDTTSHKKPYQIKPGIFADIDPKNSNIENSSDLIMLPWDEIIECYKKILDLKLGPIVSESGPEFYAQFKNKNILQLEQIFKKIGKKSKADLNDLARLMQLKYISTDHNTIKRVEKIILDDNLKLRSPEEISKDLEIRKNSIYGKIFSNTRVPDSLSFYEWIPKKIKYPTSFSPDQLVLNPMVAISNTKLKNKLSVYEISLLEAVKLPLIKRFYSKNAFDENQGIKKFKNMTYPRCIPIKISNVNNRLEIIIPDFIDILINSEDFKSKMKSYSKEAKVDSLSLKKLLNLFEGSLKDISKIHNVYNYKIMAHSEMLNKYHCSILSWRAKFLIAYRNLIANLPGIFNFDLKDDPSLISRNIKKNRLIFEKINSDLTRSIAIQYAQTDKNPIAGYQYYQGITPKIIMKSQIKKLGVKKYMPEGRKSHILAYFQLYRAIDQGIFMLDVVKVAIEVFYLLYSELIELLWTPEKMLISKILRIIQYSAYIFAIVYFGLWPTKILSITPRELFKSGNFMGLILQKK